MPYSLKTTGVIAGYTVRACLVVNEAGTGVQDLVSGNTISVDAAVTYGSASWRGTTLPWFMPTGSGFTPQGVTWTGTKPSFLVNATNGVSAILIINGWGASDNGSGGGTTERVFLRAANASADVQLCLATNSNAKPRIKSGAGGVAFTATTDNLGDVQSAYVFRVKAYGTHGTKQRTAAGSLSTEETGADPGFSDLGTTGVLESFGASTDRWFQPETYCLLVVDGIVSDSDANAIIDDWFGTLIDTGGGGGGLSVPPRRKFPRLFRFLHNL